MSDDFTMDATIGNLMEAVQFLHGAFYSAELNLNPDLGFLKANNKSAFKKIGDKTAQLAQMRLVECEGFFKENNLDMWEACTEMSIFITTHAYCNALFSEGNSAMKSDEWLEYVRTYHDEGFTGRGITMLAEETSENRDLRRSSFLFDTISRLHSKHPICASQLPDAWDLGNGQKAAFLCSPLLPTGWDAMIDEHMRIMGGMQAEEFSLSPNMSAEERQTYIQEKVDEVGRIWGADPEDPDFDDDPSRGIEW